MTTLDIILPAYNPLPGWEDIVISRFLSFEDQLPGCAVQLIIVNDGSTKINEKEAVVKFEKMIPLFQWISYPGNKGKGHALRQGAMLSTGEMVIYTDIDWPYTEESMVGLAKKLIRGIDAVIGVRDHAYYGQLPSGRRRISRLLKRFNAWLLKLKVNDTQAGLKGFRREVKPLFLMTTINRYLFDLEFIYLLSKQKELKVEGHPITLRPGITFSKMNRKILFQEARNFMNIWMNRKS